MTKDEALRTALKKAYNLGQIYWQQADSEYMSQQRKADLTEAKFKELLETTVAALEAKDEPDKYAMDIECTKCGAKQSGVLTVHTTQPQQEAKDEPVAWEAIEKVAQKRYKVVPSDASMFYRFAVVAGDGNQQLFIGRYTECQVMAKKFTGAFLDGAFLLEQMTNPPQRTWVGLTDEEILAIDCMTDKTWAKLFAQAIETKLKEKNHD